MLVHWSRAEKNAFNKVCFVEGKKQFQLCFIAGVGFGIPTQQEGKGTPHKKAPGGGAKVT